MMPDASLPVQSVSVVMVSYNTGSALWESIASVLAQPALHELIIVDNGNPDSVRKELEALKQQNPKITLITHNVNVGFAKGCNEGASHTQGEYILVLNPDCVLPPDALSEAANALHTHPDAYVAGCFIANLDNSEQTGSRRNILTPWVALVESFGLYRLAPNNPIFPRINLHGTPLPSTPFFVPAISGAFMMMPKEIYQRLGGVDEGYFLHVEDLDLCLQVQKLGGKILYLPDIKVIHYRSTSKASPFFIEYNKAKGFTRYFHKNFSHHTIPGFTYLLAAAIYLRLCFKLLSLSQKMLCRRLTASGNIPHHALELAKRVSILEQYQQLPPSPALSATSLEPFSPIILAGASGQVGLSILRRSLASSLPVTALYYKRTLHFSHPGLTWKQINLEERLLNLNGIQANSLIYTPALWLLPPALPALASTGIKRLVCFSSTSVFTKADSSNRYERDFVARLIRAENQVAELCAQHSIEWTILRPTLIYGIGLDQNITNIVRFIKRFGFFPLAGKGTGLRQPVHADDLAIAALQILGSPATYGKSYNLCGGERLSYYEMIGRIFDTLGLKRRIITISSLPLLLDIYSKVTGKPELNGEIARRMNRDMVFDDSAARESFGYSPRNFLAGGKHDLGPL